MIFAWFIFAIVFEVLMPIGVGIYLLRRYKAGWGILGVGVLTFLASQLIHYPLLLGISALLKTTAWTPPAALIPYFNGLVLGLAAGLCEETARLFGFKLLKEKAKPYGAGITAGAGHGGIESIIIGVMLAVQVVPLILILYNKISNPQITPTAAMNFFLSYPWYVPLLSAFERIVALTTQITLSVMVWRAVTARRYGWFWLAIGYHALLDGVAVVLSAYGLNTLLIEGILGLFAIINIILLALFALNFNTPTDEDDEDDTPEWEFLPTEEVKEAEDVNGVNPPAEPPTEV